MRIRSFVVSTIMVIAAVFTTILVFSAQTVSFFSSVNLIGILAATFTAVVGFAWLIKNS